MSVLDRSSGLSPMQSPLVSPEAVCRVMVERDTQQHSGEQKELPATSLNDSMSSTVSAILSPRVRTGHGVALRGLSKSLEHRTLRAGFDAELDRTRTLTARHIEKRDTRTALRLFKKEKDKVKAVHINDTEGFQSRVDVMARISPLVRPSSCASRLYASICILLHLLNFSCKVIITIFQHVILRRVCCLIHPLC